MQRRTFLKNTLLTSSGFLLLPPFTKAEGFKDFPVGGIADNFLNPPASAKPWCFWTWMNGHVSKEGITLDLEAMKRMGIGGFFNFNTGVGIPRGPVDYAGEQWKELTAHAAAEARRLGLDMALHNSPGYSGCGGPWVTPEMSMQQLVWTESRVESNGAVQIALPQPYAKKDYYRDAYVIAYPSLSCETALMQEELLEMLLNGKAIDKGWMMDGNPETKIRLEAGKDSGITSSSTTATLVLQFRKPFEARSITLTRKPEIPHDLFDGPRDHPPVIQLEYSEDGVQYKQIGVIRPPELREMDTPATLSFPPVKGTYFRLVAEGPTWLSGVELYNGPRLGGWPGKTSWTHGVAAGDTPALSAAELIDRATIIDLSNNLNATGELHWNAPKGRWTILRIGHTTTGEENAAHPDAGKGLEIDKFRLDAVDFHFTHFLDPVITAIKAGNGWGTTGAGGFKGLLCDSWEAGKQNWTPDFPRFFKNKTGYDITRWLPALTGRIVDSVEATEKFLWDVRKVQSELLADNFYGYFARCCHDRGLSFSAEPYGDGNFDSLRIGSHLDVPMAEFWTRYIYGSDLYSKQAVSISHAWGQPVVAAESFTAMPATAKWTDYPYSLKAEGDYFFSLGVNRLVFHVFVHQPYLTGKPGMTMGPFGMHIDRNNTWTEQAYGWTQYLHRTQSILQQGLTVADICYFRGDEPVSGVPDIYTWLPAGYKGDVIGPDVLQQRFKIQDAKILLPDGMRYQVCVMAPVQAIRKESLQRLTDLVRDGMTLLVSSKPDKGLGLAVQDAAIRQMVGELYGELDGKAVQERSYGRGRIIWGKSIEAVLDNISLSPDFSYTAENTGAAIHYIHKQVKDTHFYFIGNHKRQEERLAASFRMVNYQPEVWNAETGEQYDVPVFETVNNRINLPLTIGPAGSLFVVFSRKRQNKGASQLLYNKSLFLKADTVYPLFDKTKALTAADNFTITLWAKPDTFAHNGRSMLFHAPEGELLFGTGVAAIGLGAGQNGIRVYERTKGPAKTILFVETPLSGWTHIALVYTDRKPVLYINGQVAAIGNRSATTVRAVLGIPAAGEQFASYFEGNYTLPELKSTVLSAGEIKSLVRAGVPDPILPRQPQLKGQSGKFRLLAWEDGAYELNTPSGTRKQVITGCQQVAIQGNWTATFPKGKNAPAPVRLSTLTSLHLHPDPAVRYFSGTVNYAKTISLPPVLPMKGKKIFLHLGRVEVIAEVKVNGKNAGITWKEPYLLEITPFVKGGSNTIEVAVTTLWPNRLIGDETLPPENSYTKDGNLAAFPEWFIRNEPKPGVRTGFAAWQTYNQDGPLLAAGLLGPVYILMAVEKEIV